MSGKESFIWTGSGYDKLGGPAGEDGKTAYQHYLDLGGYLSYNDWYASNTGPQGPAGPTGGVGPSGPVGNGIPTGGHYGWILVKKSNTNYDCEWRQVYSSSNIGEEPATLDGMAPDGSIRGGVEKVFIAPSGVMYKTHTFTYMDEVNSLIVNYPVIGKLLVVAGGGSSGNGGGGSTGAGGGGGGTVWYGDYAFGLGIHNTYAGRGGVNASVDNKNGENSWFDSITCYGGGAGGNSGSQGAAGGCSGGNGEGSLPTISTATGGRGQYFPTNFFYSQAIGTNGGSANVTIDITGLSATYGAGGLGDQGSSSMGTGFGAGANGGPNTGANGNAGVVIVRYRIA